MNKKQIKTLALYALNYSYEDIGQILNISANTVKWRLKAVRKKYPKYWGNAQSIRTSYKKCKKELDDVRSINNTRMGKKLIFRPPEVIGPVNIDFLLLLIEADWCNFQFIDIFREKIKNHIKF